MSGVDTFNTRHKLTGKLQRLTADQIKPFEHVLEIVADDAKPLVKGTSIGVPDEPAAVVEVATDPVSEARAHYEGLIEAGNAHNSNVVREAKAALEEAEAAAEKADADAQKAYAQTQSPEGE